MKIRLCLHRVCLNILSSKIRLQFPQVLVKDSSFLYKHKLSTSFLRDERPRTPRRLGLSTPTCRSPPRRSPGLTPAAAERSLASPPPPSLRPVTTVRIHPRRRVCGAQDTGLSRPRPPKIGGLSAGARGRPGSPDEAEPQGLGSGRGPRPGPGGGVPGIRPSPAPHRRPPVARPPHLLDLQLHVRLAAARQPHGEGGAGQQHGVAVPAAVWTGRWVSGPRGAPHRKATRRPGGTPAPADGGQSRRPGPASAQPPARSPHGAPQRPAGRGPSPESASLRNVRAGGRMRRDPSSRDPKSASTAWERACAGLQKGRGGARLPSVFSECFRVSAAARRRGARLLTRDCAARWRSAAIPARWAAEQERRKRQPCTEDVAAQRDPVAK